MVTAAEGRHLGARGGLLAALLPATDDAASEPALAEVWAALVGGRGVAPGVVGSSRCRRRRCRWWGSLWGGWSVAAAGGSAVAGEGTGIGVDRKASCRERV